MTYDDELEEVRVSASWAPIDLGPYLDGTISPVVPSLLPRSDGVCLFYPGLTHSLHGESESGKSWVAQYEAARLLGIGGKVLYVDFESDAGAIIERLRLLGASDDAIRERFEYMHPEVDPRNPNEARAFEGLLTQRYDLVVIDGVTEAVVLYGFESKDNDALTRWAGLLPTRIAAETGAAVAMVDHVSKAAGGRFAIGAQAKMGTITGAAYTVETAQPLGRGLRGEIVLRVAKDRPGYVRGHSGRQRPGDRTQEAARIILDATVEGVVSVMVEPPRALGDTSGSVRFRPTTLMERISDHLEAQPSPATTNAATAVTGNKADVRLALDVLIGEGYVSVASGKNNSTLHTLIKPYRQADDPLSDSFASQGPPSTPSGWPGAPFPNKGEGGHPLRWTLGALGGHLGGTRW